MNVNARRAIGGASSELRRAGHQLTDSLAALANEYDDRTLAYQNPDASPPVETPSLFTRSVFLLLGDPDIAVSVAASAQAYIAPCHMAIRKHASSTGWPTCKLQPATLVQGAASRRRAPRRRRTQSPRLTLPPGVPPRGLPHAQGDRRRDTPGIVPFVVELREWRTPCFRTEVVYSTPRQQPHRRAGPARPRRRPGSVGRGSPAPAGSAAPPPPARSPPTVESSVRRATA